MIADGMSGRGDSSYQVRLPLSRFPEHEEGGARLMPLEKIEKARSKFGVRTVVEREGGHGISGGHVGDGPHGLANRDRQRPTKLSKIFRHHLVVLFQRFGLSASIRRRTLTP